MEDLSQNPKKRPDFLTALCALSFANAGYKIFDAVTNMAADPEKTIAELETAMEEVPDEAPGFVGEILSQTSDVTILAAENAIPMGASQMVLFLLSAVGVFLMFKMNKKGFFVYSAANVLALFIPIIFLGASSLVLITVGLAFVFTALFIGLYASNLKHLS